MTSSKGSRRSSSGLLARLRPARDSVSGIEERRKAFLESAAAFTPYVTVEREEGTFLVPVRGADKLFAGAPRTEFTVLARAVSTLADHGLHPRGGTIVDVGANIGTTTVAALVVHGFGRGVAIEPDPENRMLLRASLALSGIDDRVEVVGAAASHRPGWTKFDRSRRKEGRYRIGSGRISRRQAAPEDISVETVSLDDLVERGVIEPAAVKLLWLDVQGHEGEVFAGASALLERRVPVVFALRPRSLTDPAALADRLRDGYDVLVDLRRPSLHGDWAPELEEISVLTARLGERRLTTDMLAFAAAG